ncbi:biliverdin-producing heme oxygenase [Arthrobacter russicus]|jgi:heme oxygenase|uniref:Heme oxygenase n=1 Tax=Arthrobacter russicus TaxID=172040 RepID=A0ABU1JF94_9MICC|nr:biliverdin-producing heme oxygenase [Arthrobacter russicus]MDR6271050.1 heme oxygenase [Arthrobacter russicus]
MSSSTGFSQTLRDSTQFLHQQAHDSPFISELMSGKRSLADYTALAAQQYFVYHALESMAARLAEDEVVGGFHSAELSRVPEIEKDLAFLIGPQWRELISPLPATADYLEQIDRSAEWPVGFIAHHYTRYLGDLSGGQIMQRLLQRQFGLNLDGVRFYSFPAIPKTKPFKDRYRAKLNALGLAPAEQERVVAEVHAAFKLNIAMFADLADASAAAA